MQLPDVTDSAEQARIDLQAAGIARLTGLIGPDEIEQTAGELFAIADDERADGSAFLEDGSASDGNYRPGANQRLLGLVGKSPAVASLAANETVTGLIGERFAVDYGLPAEVVREYGFDGVLLSSFTGNIANRGGCAMNLHADQGFVPPSTDYPVFVNVIWALSEFTADNGATRVVPGSHLRPPQSLYLDAPHDSVPATAPAGTAILIDGRLWHGTGMNTTDAPRLAGLGTYSRPWIRQFENLAVTMSDADLAAATPRLRKLMGFDRWSVYGSAEVARLEGVS